MGSGRENLGFRIQMTLVWGLAWMGLCWHRRDSAATWWALAAGASATQLGLEVSKHTSFRVLAAPGGVRGKGCPD